MSDDDPVLTGDGEVAPEPERPRRRRLWVLLLVVAVLAAAGGVLGSRLLDSGNEPDPTGTANGSTEPATETGTTTPSEDEPRYVVEAGGGGTTVASVDGVTPMGYEQTCEGGIAAATNQWMTIGVYADQWWTEAGLARLEELLAYFSPGDGNLSWDVDYLEGREIDASVVQQSGDLNFEELHPEVGAFRLVSCTKSEVIVDLIYGVVTTTVSGEERTSPTYSSARVTVRWLDDWSIRDVVSLPGEDRDAIREVQPEPGGEFTTQLREQLLAAGGPEWLEYSNAP